MADDVPRRQSGEGGAHAPPSQLHLHTAFENVMELGAAPPDTSTGSAPAAAEPHHRRDSTLRPRSRSAASHLSVGGSRTRATSATASPSSGHGMLDPALMAAAAAMASHPRYLPSAFTSAGAPGLGTTSVHPDILDDLRALDDLEGGSLLRPLLQHVDGGDGSCYQDGGDASHGRDGAAGGDGYADGASGGGMHVDEAETYEMQELMEAKKAKDVLQYIEEEGGCHGYSVHAAWPHAHAGPLSDRVPRLVGQAKPRAWQICECL